MEDMQNELFKEIFLHAVITGEIQVSFHGMERTVAEVIEGKCYQALQKIKAVISDDSLEDPECIWKVEEILCVLEEIGCSGGCRHDYG